MVVEIPQLSTVVLGKRRRSIVSINEDDRNSEDKGIEEDNIKNNIDLPVNRITGRARVHLVYLNGYDTTMRQLFYNQNTLIFSKFNYKENRNQKL